MKHSEMGKNQNKRPLNTSSCSSSGGDLSLKKSILEVEDISDVKQKSDIRENKQSDIRLLGTGLFHESTPMQHQTSFEASGRRFVKRKEIEVRQFKGKDSVEDYLLQFELAAPHNFLRQEKTSSLLWAGQRYSG